MENKIDSETEITLREGQAYLDFIQSRGWLLAKDQIITPALMDLQSVQDIKHNSPTDMARAVYAKQLAVEYLMAIIRSIEGRGEQHAANRELMRDPIQII